MTKAVWRNTKTGREISGAWTYVRASDIFHISLEKPVGRGGEMRKRFSLLGYDGPEWGNWKLVRNT